MGTTRGWASDYVWYPPRYVRQITQNAINNFINSQACTPGQGDQPSPCVGQQTDSDIGSQDGPASFQMFGRSFDHQTLTLWVSPHQTVDELQQQFANKNEAPWELQQLPYGCKILSPARTLADYKLQPHTTVYLNPAPKGEAQTPCEPNKSLPPFQDLAPAKFLGEGAF